MVRRSLSPIIWHPEGGDGDVLLLGSLRSCWPSQVTRAAAPQPPSTLLQSDVHLKLRFIPNCMLPVMIVQVVQVVHFYFGVFN